MNLAKIKVYVLNNKPFIWNSCDACRLREEFRLVGNLVGCLTGLPKQNVHLGLPLQLLPEELTLLLDKGVVDLHDDSELPSLPSVDDIKEFEEYRRKLYEEQVAISRKEREKKMRSHWDEIVEGRKRCRRDDTKQVAEHDALTSQATSISKESSSNIIRTTEEFSSSENIKQPTISHEQGVPDESTGEVSNELALIGVDIPTLSLKYSLVQIPLANKRRRHLSSPSPIQWNFPSTPKELIRYRVFKDLWEKGHSLTAGGKFGGDFLVYPGDPSRYHSFYIAICLERGRTLSALELVAMGRLGSNVKKTVVLCSMNDINERPEYLSLQWTGLS